ncbi:LysR family transcriptional regulator [Azohydromonas caseinilytica]|uniref:LysR family transcriptional regulator n=1 Tax=Azohydromonas caseinilytica TaxID=2728836 RepID=A0A848FJ41_9BURK|nr:LysR family transcriptional regulator [Azohydromonas caseinilytica]NML18915.1 LysR family transcriptional regulator [Azohydromonas caseinilytica]
MDNKFSAMQAYVRVVEAGTFTRAAESLGLPKPTVTRLIQALETHLQTKLLNRTTRRVTVTADGAAYYDRALRILGELDELESSMSHAKINPRGRLRIDVAASVGQLLLIPALPDFHARYPHIQIDLGVSDRPVDLIGENVDCVLRGGEITDQSLVARRIGEFHTILCATPDYLQRHGVPLHPHDLENGQHHVVNYLSHRTGRPYPLELAKGEERIELRPRHVVSVNDSGANLIAGLAGLGIVRTSTFQAQPHIASGALVPVLLDWCAQSIPIHVVYPPNRHLSAKLRVFVDWVADLFARSDLILKRCCLPLGPEPAWTPCTAGLAPQPARELPAGQAACRAPGTPVGRSQAKETA